MRDVSIIVRREVGQYFASPVAYLIAFALLVTTGLLFYSDLNYAMTVRPPDPAVIPNFLSFALIFFAPLLTMRMLAEESREGTLELLLTAPVSDGAIVLGKFIAAWLFYSILLLIMFSYQLILVAITQPDLGYAICAYIGIWLYGGAALAVGLLFSAVTENQIVAAFLSIGVLLFLYLAELAGDVVTNLDMAAVIRSLTLQGHFTTSFAFGFVRAEDVAYYAGIMAIMLFIAIRVIESHRWR